MENASIFSLIEAQHLSRQLDPCLCATFDNIGAFESRSAVNLLVLFWSAAFSVESSSGILLQSQARTEGGFCLVSGCLQPPCMLGLFMSLVVAAVRKPRCLRAPRSPNKEAFSLTAGPRFAIPGYETGCFRAAVTKSKGADSWAQEPSCLSASSCICIFNFQLSGGFVLQLCPFKLSVRIVFPVLLRGL